MSNVNEDIITLNRSEAETFTSIIGSTTSVSYESHSEPSKCNAVLGTTDGVKVCVILFNLKGISANNKLILQMIVPYYCYHQSQCKYTGITHTSILHTTYDGSASLLNYS